MANDISKDLQQICKVLSALNTNVLGLVRETKRQNDTLDEMAAVLKEVHDILYDFELEEIEEPREIVYDSYPYQHAVQPREPIDFTKYTSTGDNPYDEH